MNIKEKKSREIHTISAGILCGRKDPLSEIAPNELTFRHEYEAIEEIRRMGSVDIAYYELQNYSLIYIIFEGSIANARNRERFIYLVMKFKNLRKIGLFGTFPIISLPNLEYSPPEIHNFFSSNLETRVLAAKHPDLAQLKEYRVFFKQNIPEIDIAIASNPNAVYFKEFKSLFDRINYHIALALANNPNAAKITEFKQLFSYNHPSILKKIAQNPNAVDFEEYKFLFSHKSFEVRSGILLNPKAARFSEYYSLIPANFRERLRFPSILPKKMFDYPEAHLLFNDSDERIRISLALTPEASNFIEYEG